MADRTAEVLQSHGAPIGTVKYASNGAQEISPEALKGMVGNKSWTVVFGDPNLDAKLAQLTTAVEHLQNAHSQLETEVGHLRTLALPPMIANVAAQILLFLIEEQPLVPTPTSKRFKTALKAEEAKRQKIESCAKILDNKWSSASFAKAADNLLDRRNGLVHAATIDELDDMVASVKHFIETYPAANAMKHEVKIILHYNEIKTLFNHYDHGSADSELDSDLKGEVEDDGKG